MEKQWKNYKIVYHHKFNNNDWFKSISSQTPAVDAKMMTELMMTALDLLEIEMEDNDLTQARDMLTEIGIIC